MKHSRFQSMRRAAGFTLIELMVVIVILGLLVTIVAPQFGTILEDAKVDTTKTAMINIEKTIDIYRLKKGKLPDTLNELIESGLLPGPDLPLDGWGHEFQYNKQDKRKFDLVSLGADGQEGGEDEHDRDINLVEAHKRPKDE